MTMTASMGGSSSASAPKTSVVGGRPPMGRVVRAVIRKELQQNWVTLALVMCLESIIVCAAEWFRSGWLFDWNHSFHNLLLYPAVRGAITLGCAAGGLLLGLLQPLADRNFDLWAFLTHRPVPRWWLYLGRAAAGVILYAIAAGLPVAFALALAPTHWGGEFFITDYMRPPIADWVAGLVYYFAGLLIMERQARWYGSRAVPLIAAIVGSLAVAWVSSFALALGVSVSLMAIYAIASMGSAISHGYTLRAPRWTKLALIVVIFVGFTSLLSTTSGGSLAGLVGLRRQVLWPGTTYYPGYDSPIYWTQRTSFTIRQYELMPNATLAISTTTSDEKIVNHQHVITERSHDWTDLKGAPFRLSGTETWDDFHTRQEGGLAEQSFGQQSGSDLLARDFAQMWYRQLDGRVSETVVPDPGKPPLFETAWYWVPNRGLFYLYHQLTYNEDPHQIRVPSEYLGTVGANGFSGPGKEAERFERPFYGVGAIVLTPHALYHVHTSTRGVQRFFTVPPDEYIHDIHYEVSYHANGDAFTEQTQEGNLWISTNQRILRVSPTGDVLLALPLPHHTMNQWLTVIPFPKLQRWVVRLSTEFEGSARDRSETYWFYDWEGKLLDQKEIPHAYEVTNEPPESLLPSGVRELQKTEWEAGVLAVTANPLLSSTGFSLLFRQTFPDTAWKSLGLGVAWRFYTSMLAAMVACGAMGWGLTRAYALRRGGWAWTLLALLCGPSALLTFVATHTLPKRTKCPACGRRRLQDRERCGKCGAAWPKATPAGTEIWAADNGATAQ